jgi:hypothetical protein
MARNFNVFTELYPGMRIREILDSCYHEINSTVLLLSFSLRVLLKERPEWP